MRPPGPSSYPLFNMVRWGTAVLMLTPPEYAVRVQQAAAHGLGRLLPWSSIVRAQAETDRLVRGVIAARRREGTAGRSDVLSVNAPAENGSLSTSIIRPPSPISERASIVRTPTEASNPNMSASLPAPSASRTSRPAITSSRSRPPASRRAGAT